MLSSSVLKINICLNTILSLKNVNEKRLKKSTKKRALEKSFLKL